MEPLRYIRLAKGLHKRRQPGGYLELYLPARRVLLGNLGLSIFPNDAVHERQFDTGV